MNNKFLNIGFFLFLILYCSTKNEDIPYMPASLPSEASIKKTLESAINLQIITSKSRLLKLSLDEWKQKEREKVKDSEIQSYWKEEKKRIDMPIRDYDLLQKRLDSIRIRLAWARIFHSSGIVLTDSFGYKDPEFIKKVNTDHSPRSGNPEGSITIIEWKDFQCGYCKKSFLSFENLPKSITNNVTWIHKDFPLNPDSEEGLVPLAVSRCLFKKSKAKYREYMKFLYKIDTMPTEDYNNLYKDCTKDSILNEYKKMVLSDRREARNLGINSVPFYWINGTMVVGYLSEDAWKEILVGKN